MNSNGRDTGSILIVDDDAGVRDLLVSLLGEKYRCLTANSGDQALALLRQERPGLAISDINMPGMSGLDLIPHVFATSPDTVVMMISGYGTFDNAAEAIRAGAYDFLRKPFELDHVEMAVKRALGHHALLAGKRRHEEELEKLVEERTKRIEYLAWYDELTHLPNRALFEDRLHQSLLIAAEEHRAAVLIVAPDRFREVHDTLGHSSGNSFLTKFAQRLSACTSAEATVARFEASEFAVLLPEVGSAAEVGGAIGSVFTALRVPLEVDGHRLNTTASVGIALFPEDGSDADTLIKHAGIALARAASEGQNSYEFYTGEMHAAAMRRLEIENGLRQALAEEQFEAHYQPMIETSTGKIVGAEALIRWRDPHLGQVPPDEFICVAEEAGVIGDIGRWMLRESCSQARAWHDARHPIHIAVNLSAAQFDRWLAETVREALDDSGLDPSYLNLEVTESSIMKNAEFAAAVLKDLKRIGIKVSIDDFGTGYSSLAHLKRLPIDVLKIDRSFVTDLTTDHDAVSLVMAIIGLAHNLGLGVVAEGVETEAQLSILNLLRCDEWQGYLLSRPVPVKEFNRLLAEKAL